MKQLKTVRGILLLLMICSTGLILSCGKPATDDIEENVAEEVQEVDNSQETIEDELAIEIPDEIEEIFLSDLDKAREAGKYIESILIFDSYNGDGADEKCGAIMAFASMEYNEEERTDFIKSYLQSWDMYKEKPDGVISGAEKTQVEYYSDEIKGKTCFIVHMYFDSWVDAKDNVRDAYEKVYCIAVVWNGLEQKGSLSYERDETGKVIAESLYDVNGESIAEISYEYMPGIVFPFIEKYQSTEEDDYEIRGVLNRNNKFWLYKDGTEIDESGIVQKYSREIYYGGEYEADILCTYNEEGQLQAFLEQLSDFDIEMECDEEYSGEVLFRYKDDKNLELIDYRFCTFSHGTWDSSGEIYFDEQNRMVYRECYITHGRHYWVYLYEGEETRPRAIIYICNQPYSWEEDGSAYGGEMSVSFFTPE